MIPRQPRSQTEGANSGSSLKWGDLEDEVKLPPGIQRLSSIERRLFFEQLELYP